METPAPDASDTSTQPSQPKRLFRLRDDKLIAGVGSGIAHYFDIDPVIVRLALVALVFAGGIGVALYIVAWCIMPLGTTQATSSAAVAGDETTSTRELPGAAKVAVIGITVFTATIAIANHGAWIWGVLLVGVGVLLLRRPDSQQRDAQQRDAQSQTNTPVAHAAVVTTPNAGHVTTSSYGGNPAFVVSRPTRMSNIVPLTFAALLLLVGGTALLDELEVLDITFQQLLALGTIVLGLGALISAWLGKAPVLIGLAVLMLPLTAISSTVDTSFPARIGDTQLRPTSIADVEPNYSMGVGNLIVDLSSINLDGRSLTTKVEFGLGQAVVIVPKGVPVKANTSLGLGKLDVMDRDAAGTQPRLTLSPADDVMPLVTLEVDGGIGHVVVTDDPNSPEIGRKR